MLSFISDWLKDSILSKSILVIYAIINSHLDCNSAFYLNMKQSDLQRHLLADYSEQIILLSPLTPQNIELSSRLQCLYSKYSPDLGKLCHNEALQGKKKSYLPEKELPCDPVCSSLIPQGIPPLPPRCVLYLCKKIKDSTKTKAHEQPHCCPGVNWEKKNPSDKHYLWQ